jgi:hypothetical protein
MSIREFLKRFRLQSVQAGDGKRQEDKVDALATSGHMDALGDWGGGNSAPVNWVPSQQDERPRY